LKAGTTVIVPTFHVMRDEGKFENPFTFDTTRFQRGEQEGGAFTGFGTGMHPCPGKNFILLEIAIFLAEALKQFDWKIVDAEKPTITDDAFTKLFLKGVPNHPRLIKSQAAFISRAADPVILSYERTQ